MIRKADKNEIRVKKHARVRNKVVGTAERPRLNVYRSTTNIYAQIIDDVKGNTICSSSTLDKKLATKLAEKNKKEQAYLVGQDVAKRALKAGIKEVVFDRGGYIYTGRVARLADGAREAGLKF